MKTVIISDLHGKDHIEFIDSLGLDRIAALGDYDDPEILKKLLALKKAEIVLVGNHDLFLSSQRIMKISQNGLQSR